MDKEQLIDFLGAVEHQGIASLHSNGYSWVKSNFLPHLELADTLIPDEGELLADCWYLMGDVYDFNGAPLKAIESYQKAIECDEDIDGAYREIANMYEQVGQYEEALKYINITIDKVEKGNEEWMEALLEDKAVLQDSINYQTEAYFTADNLAWKLNERLANEDFNGVIKTVTAIENPEMQVLQCLARAYGAKDMEEEVLAVWEQIANATDAFQLEYADWYFLPMDIYNSNKIWLLLKRCSERIDGSNFIYFDSLLEHYGEELSESQIVELVCDYQICLANKNQTGLDILAKEFPRWEEVNLGL